MNIEGNRMYIAYMDNLTVNGSANVIQYMHYLPFGEDWVDQRNSSWNVPYTFSGKEKDAETGYSYFGARYYDSSLSIWLSIDPMSDKYPNMSPYIYCANNPITIVDFDGRDTSFKTTTALEAFKTTMESVYSKVNYYTEKLKDPKLSNKKRAAYEYSLAKYTEIKNEFDNILLNTTPLRIYSDDMSNEGNANGSCQKQTETFSDGTQKISYLIFFDVNVYSALIHENHHSFQTLVGVFNREMDAWAVTQFVDPIFYETQKKNTYYQYKDIYNSNAQNAGDYSFYSDSDFIKDLYNEEIKKESEKLNK